MKSLKEVSKTTGIPEEELKRLMALQYGKGVLPRGIARRSIGFSKEVFSALKEEMKDDLKSNRRDAQKHINAAFNLILCNLVVSAISHKRLSLSGSEKDYNKGTYLNKLFLTYRAVHKVTNALIKHKYIKFKKGSKVKKEVNSYQPTKKLELILLPLIYEVQEEYLGKDNELIIFIQEVVVENAVTEVVINAVKSRSKGMTKNHTMRRRSYFPDLPADHPDRVGLRRINEYLQDVTYALKSPVKRIYSHNDPMQGGRLYTRLQGLPDRRARVRINTLFDGKPVAEVDLSANHPRMLMALDKKKLPANFYDDIAAQTKTTRDQVKFLVTRAIGASDKRISLKPDVDEKDWYSTDFVVTPKQRLEIEEAIKTKVPELFEKFYKGNGVYMQALEGDILLKAMLDLIDQDIPSLPIHDAIYVQRRHKTQAKKALENAWMEVLGVGFKPAIKSDISQNQYEH